MVTIKDQNGSEYSKWTEIWLPIDPRARLHINANIFMASLSLSMNFNSSGHLNFQADQVTMNHEPKLNTGTANSRSELKCGANLSTGL